MSDNLTPQAKELDDQLASFTDQLLDHQEAELTETSMQDQQLHELQEMVVRLNNAFGASRPDKATAKRIEAHLVKEWHRFEKQARPVSLVQSWLQSLISGRQKWHSTTKRRHVSALALAAMAVALLVLVFPLLSQTKETLAGAVSGPQGLIFLLPVLGLALGGVLWLLLQRRR